MGLLPDAKPRPSDPDPADAGGSRASARQGASALLGLRQRAAAGDRPPLSGALFLGITVTLSFFPVASDRGAYRLFRSLPCPTSASLSLPSRRTTRPRS